jgi:hypothetical protein
MSLNPLLAAKSEMTYLARDRHLNPRFLERLSATLVIIAVFGGCVGTTTQPPAAHDIYEYAHLKATRQKGYVYTDVGTATGTSRLTMTLVMNDATGQGTYEAIAPNGAFYGEIATNEASLTHRTSKGALIYDFSGDATVTHGTGIYRNGRAPRLRMHGEIMTSSHRLNMIFGGIFYY